MDLDLRKARSFAADRSLRQLLLLALDFEAGAMWEEPFSDVAIVLRALGPAAMFGDKAALAKMARGARAYLSALSADGKTSRREALPNVADRALTTASEMLAKSAPHEEIADAVFVQFWVLGAGSLELIGDIQVAREASAAAVKNLKKKSVDPKAIVRAVFKACGYRELLFKKLDQKQHVQHRANSQRRGR
jgi:hypothetical protein